MTWVLAFALSAAFFALTGVRDAALLLWVAPLIGLATGFFVTHRARELRLGRLALWSVLGASAALLTQLGAFPDEGIASALYRSLLLFPPLLMVATGVGGALSYVFFGGGKLDLQFQYEAFVAMRYLRSLRGSVLSVVTVIALVGIVLGVMAMVVSLGILSGFEGDLIEKIIGADSHLTVTKHPGYLFEKDELAPAAKAAEQFGSVAFSPFVNAEVLVASDSNHTEAKLIGVDLKSGPAVFGVFRKLTKGGPDRMERTGRGSPALPPPTEDPLVRRVELPQKDGAEPLDIMPEKKPYFDGHKALPGVIIGSEMARTLHVDLDDVITIVSPLVEELTPLGPAPKTKTFRVAGLFDMRMYVVDAHYMYVLMPEAQRFLELGDTFSGVAFSLRDPQMAEQAQAEIVTALGGYPMQALSWQQRNKNLFMSLKLEKAVAFIVLIFIVLVASFSIVNTLTMSVIEKAREIAILKTMGAKDVSISRIFVLQGLVVGLVGTVVGAVLGCALAIGLTKVGLAVDPDVYYMDHLPVRLHLLDIVQVCLLTLVLTALSAVFPALTASRLSPVEGLRYE